MPIAERTGLLRFMAMLLSLVSKEGNKLEARYMYIVRALFKVFKTVKIAVKLFIPLRSESSPSFLPLSS